MIRRIRFSRATNAEAVQRSTICPSRQRVTRPVFSRIPALADSIVFVLARHPPDESQVSHFRQDLMYKVMYNFRMAPFSDSVCEESNCYGVVRPPLDGHGVPRTASYKVIVEAPVLSNSTYSVSPAPAGWYMISLIRRLST